MITVYGIKACDTCRKARRWLDQSGTDYRWVDLRESPVAKAILAGWWQELGESLVNRRSTTWRQLTDAQRDLSSAAAAVALLTAHPTLIKRPLVQWDKTLTVGFNETQWQSRL